MKNEYSPQTDLAVRNGEMLLLIRQWDVSLGGARVWGQKTVPAIRPFLRQWLSRHHGELNYYSSQVLTGHGSFGHFLHRIGKRANAKCYHCPSDDDSLEHTKSDCPTWSHLRAEFAEKIGVGNRLSLPIIISKILAKKENWPSFTYFAASVLKIKEEEERRRERDSPSLSP